MSFSCSCCQGVIIRYTKEKKDRKCLKFNLIENFWPEKLFIFFICTYLNNFIFLPSLNIFEVKNFRRESIFLKFMNVMYIFENNKLKALDYCFLYRSMREFHISEKRIERRCRTKFRHNQHQNNHK